MFHGYGHVYIKSVNLSHNKANYYSSLCSWPSIINEETKHGSDVIFCSFSNNTAQNQYCIFISNTYNTLCTHEIRHCNIIENEASNTIYSKGKTDIISSCISGNKNPCFYIEDSNSFITLYFCSIDNEEGSFTSHGTTKSFIHGLTFLETGFCDSSFDVVYSLIPSSPNEIKTRKCQCTEILHNYFSISYHTLHCMFFLIYIYSF